MTIASAGGVSGLHAARRFGFAEATTDIETIFSDDAISSVIIATRHDSHVELVTRALAAGKHVFVEKPLALTLEEVDAIEVAHARAPGRQLMVGFNRRFAPHVRRMKTLLDDVAGPKAFVMTVNAGSVPADHWTRNLEIGGGRIIGEGCHFIDLLRHVAGAAITGHRARALGPDTVTIDLSFADGSIGTVHYFANGSKSFPKERLEVFARGRVLQLDNFRVLRGFGWAGVRRNALMRQDKGQRAAAAAFLKAVEEGGEPPIPFAELTEVARVSIEIASSL